MEESMILPPQKPKPEDCCGSGCKVCVWKVYEKELEKYELKINAKLKKPISNGLIFTPQQIYVFFHQPIASEKNKEELSFYSNSQIEKLGWTKEEERDVQFINVPIKAMKILQCRNNEPYLLQLELNIEKSNYLQTYDVGDSIGISCPNDEQLVDDLLNYLSFDPNRTFSIFPYIDINSNLEEKSSFEKIRSSDLPTYIRDGCTIKEAFLLYLEITNVLSRKFLSMMLRYTSNEEDQSKLWKLISPDGIQLFEDLEKAKLNLLDLLQLFPSCFPPLFQLLTYLPRLKPRYFSIASSRLIHSKSLLLYIGLVNWNITRNFGRTQEFQVSREGLCSKWLKSILYHYNNTNLLPEIPILLKSSLNFNFPESFNTPLILVANGTGISPFLAFLEHRKYLQEKNPIFGDWWFFYGCRSQEEFSFKPYIEQLIQEKILHKLILAESRTSNKAYVQDKLLEFEKEIIELLFKDRATIYVCGSSSCLNGVENAIKILIKNKLQTSTPASSISSVDQVQETLLLWKKRKRFIFEVWN